MKEDGTVLLCTWHVISSIMGTSALRDLDLHTSNYLK